jgi:hypothetical protein
MVTFASVVLWASLGADAACYPLHEAARSNDVPRIRQLLAGRVLGLTRSQEGENLNRTGDFGACANRTPLMVAAEGGNVDAVRELLARGADPSLIVDDPELGRTSAWCLALMSPEGRRVAGVFQTELWLGGPEAVCADDARLIWAVRYGTLAAVEYELHAGASQKGLAYALNASVGRRELDVVRPELLSRMHDLSELEAAKTAVRSGDTVTLTQLGGYGARSSSQSLLPLLNATDTDLTRAQVLRAVFGLTRPTTGQLAYMAWDALSRDRLDTLDALSESGARLGPDSATEWLQPDDQALTMALSSRNPTRAVGALLALGVPLATGHALSRVAAESGSCDLAELLAAAGAELNQVDVDCRTPLELAVANGHPLLARALERAVRHHPRLQSPGRYCAGAAERDPVERAPLQCELSLGLRELR